MDPIKEAFQKAKQDILDLKSQLVSLSEEIENLKKTLLSTQQANQQTDRQKISANESQNYNSPAQTSADILAHKALKTENMLFSTGNKGVPTDRQTNQQTDNKTQKASFLEDLPSILTSLEALKSEVRINFSKLTKQEMRFFLAIYSLEEQGFIVDYPLLAQKLSLTESSIRDYTQRLIKKGIPLIKNKENNKKILLSLPPEFKKILSLSSLKDLSEPKLNRLNE